MKSRIILRTLNKLMFIIGGTLNIILSILDLKVGANIEGTEEFLIRIDNMYVLVLSTYIMLIALGIFIFTDTKEDKK